MGTLIGHIGPGIGFVVIGLWHMFNTIKNYALQPCDFKTRPWFPTRMKGHLKYMELLTIIIGSCLSILMELFIGPQKHQPFDADWSIPSYHLNNFEHSSISLFFLIYASVSLFVEIHQVQIPEGLLHILGAFAFSQELLLFHLHSADHMGVEGQYHWLLQVIVFTCMACTLLEIAYPHGFLVAMVRSMSIFFQGWWFIHMGFMLWVPKFVPKDCEMHEEDGHYVVRCISEEANMRAKALANLQFNWFLAGIIVFTAIMYIQMVQRYNHRINYHVIDNMYGDEGAKDVEMGGHHTEESQRLIVMGNRQAQNLER
eukprot:Gb_14794 [translate_table: standard]